MPRCKAPEVLRVASRRIRSDFCHAAKTVRRPENGSRWAFFSILMKNIE
jgi:hypothetical protein